MENNSPHHGKANVGAMPARFIAITISVFLFLSGCAVNPKPIGEREVLRINHADLEAVRQTMEPIARPLSLQEAVARALKYNLDYRTKVFEQALAAGQLESGRYDMLPKLLAEAGYSWRDEEYTRRSENPDTGAVSDVGFISNDKSHTLSDLGLHWNILDFGLGYYNAKENADRVLIALERRRRSMHTLIQNVRIAFWRAAAAQKLSKTVQNAIAEAETALVDSRKLSNERVRSPREALYYQRNLLENLRLLENVDRELSIARIELAKLIGIEPGSPIELAEPSETRPTVLDVPMQRMEEIALANNADLREQHYSARIAAVETRRALLKLLPNLSFNYNWRDDDDNFLINNQWLEAGTRVSFNLFNVLAAPKRMKAANIGVTLAETKRMAVQMSVLTQVHLASRQYDDALRQYQRANDLFDVDTQLMELAVVHQQSQMSGRLDRIAANVSYILSEVRLYQSRAKVQEAASRIQATLGLEPRIGSLDETTLSELILQIEESLENWIQLSNPLGQVNPPPKPGLKISSQSTPAVLEESQRHVA